MCFYVFPLVISWAFCSTGTPGDGERRQTRFDVVEFSAIGERRKESGAQKKKKKHPGSEMQNVIASSIMFKRTLSLHRELLGLLSFTQ